MGECRYTMTMSCYARIEPLIILFHAEIERQCYICISKLKSSDNYDC